ncbi:Bacteriophytochrome (light-regulated signal transduction histidine kinase) [Cellulosimicrobium cellulans J34]|nr:HAMP domain-containing histidine kinase [Cellulosimicrobium sp. MM]TWG82340.1 Bacteriophytochrome (light-regulated signal transduction histidine kinase) [Cellulosimicrobium cellulans J34]SMF33738.1 Bacteriophytochrome (light-regulated signal transduction histidine kinase) [Cellulosimicrobium cellulans J1]
MSGPTEGARVGRAPTLRRRLGWALVVAGVILLGVLATSAVALSRVLTLQHDVTGPFFDAVTEADAAYVGLLDAEVAVRAYVATGDDTALEAYVRAVEVDAAGVVPDPALVDRLDLDDELAAALARADASVRAWVVDYAEPAIATTEDDGPGRVRAADQADGALLFAAARADTAQYVDLLRAEREERLSALDRWSRALFGSVLVLVGSALAVGIILWVCLKRWVTEPMTALAHRVRLVSSGSLDEPVTTSGPAEIADLAQDVEHMRVELVNQVAQIKASHEDAARSHELLAERTRELERSNRDLEQFAYVASHDLQEPLRKVASFTQLLKKRYGGQLDDRADQYIDFAVDGAKRMQRLIQDLLGFSRVGRTGTERVDVDLERELGGVLEDLSEKIVETGATVTHDPLPVVVGERALLHQLLANLLGNALKFRDPERAPVVHVGVLARDTHWELSVEDNGIGIDPQYADRVFVIFQRLHAKDVYEGTGIGLALCKRIVEYHGGRIWIEPREGGTTIRFTLAHAYVHAQVGYARSDHDAAEPDAPARVRHDDEETTA